MNDDYVFINEVGPRDGLQNQKTIMSAPARIELIEKLIDANFPGIEVASFVSPKAVPAMEGAGEIMHGLNENKKCEISVLVPNLKGFELARDAGAKIISVVPSATETMNQKNINMGLEAAINSSCDILKETKSIKLKARGYVAVAWECPFEGKVDKKIILKIAEKLVLAGADEIILADTIGAANPSSVGSLIKDCVNEFGQDILSVHFHDTRAMALANVCAALTEGIRKFDSCIGGLGGCPFAPGAAGNLATEDLANMLYQMGFVTNVHLEKLPKIVDFCETQLNTSLGGRMTAWLSN